MEIGSIQKLFLIENTVIGAIAFLVGFALGYSILWTHDGDYGNFVYTFARNNVCRTGHGGCL